MYRTKFPFENFVTNPGSLSLSSRPQSPEREGCEQKRAKTEAALAQDVIAWGEATSGGRDTSAFTPWTPTAPLAASLKGGKLLALQPHLIREG